jgi:hypothetical protein
MPEGFLFEMFVGNGFNLERLSLDGQPLFSVAAGRLFQEGPGAQCSVINNSQVKVRPAGFMLMNYESRISRTDQMLAPYDKICKYFGLSCYGHPSRNLRESPNSSY